MVFESLVADLLNRFLGDFVDNLDASQLNIGIWGGDVKLNNLEIKETALDELDLPVKLKYGFLSRLVLKIPWKNLYTEPVIANVEGLYLIVVPNKGVVYNDQKAAKNDFDAKQKALARLEENRKNRRKPKDPAADSFAEKMVAQVVKNLQIHIKNIHVRFEDKYTNRHRPFVAGITLQALEFQTTDENWKATILKDAVKIFHKLISMQNLAIYWNSTSSFISDLDSKEDIRKALLETIVTKDNRPADFKYILQPISMEAKLALNQKPESDGSNWTIPKIDLSVGMEQLALGIGRLQYQDILLFLEAQERFNLATRYLKYRPNLVEYKGHAKEWWKFAFTSILEENIRRRKRNWSWKRMKEHRSLVRDYRDAWLRKQTEKSLDTETSVLISEAERRLDVFNLNIARQQAEMKIDRLGLTRVEDQPQGWGAWASSWFGGGGGGPKPTKKPKEPAEDDLLGKFQQNMTPEEKQKLFDAIDYQENTPPTDYPKEYVENKIAINFGVIAVIVEEVLELKFSKLAADVTQRPSARAIHIKSSIKSLEMQGCGQPMLTLVKKEQNWMDLEVETNPLNGEFDQFVYLGIKPVLLKYHAPAVNAALDVFKPPESVRLNQLTAAALARYEDVKARSVTGLQHAVDEKSKLKLRIQIDPATIVVTEGGIYDKAKPTLLTELGVLTIDTTDESDPAAYADITDERHRKVVMAAYDKFQLRLSNMQVIFAEDFDKAYDARGKPEAGVHVLRPTGLDIGIHKSSIDDLNMPKLRVFGDLPDVVVAVSDTRLISLMKLINSIPKPAPGEPEEVVDIAAPVPATKLRDRAKMKAIMEVDEIEVDEGIGSDSETSSAESKEEQNKRVREQQVQIDVNLKLNQIGVIVSSGNKVVIDANLRRFGCKLQMRTFDLVVKVYLGSLTVEQPNFVSLTDEGKTLFLIDNPQITENEHLVDMTYVMANEESPFFATVYKSTKQSIDFNFKKLNLTLHQEALVYIKSFGEQLQAQLAALNPPDPGKEATDGGQALKRHLSESIASLHSIASQATSNKLERRKSRKRGPHGKKLEKLEIDTTKVIDMAINAKIQLLQVMLGTSKGASTSLAIEDVKSTVTMKPKVMYVTAGLRSIQMIDETPDTLHQHLLAVSGDEEMFHMDFTQYNLTPEEKKRRTLSDVDMAVKIRFAQLRFVFLNLWVNRMLNWISPFQAEAAVAAAQAQVIAQEKAAETAANVKQIIVDSPPRLLLDIELGAPTILIPRISTSREVIIVDLGRLLLKNRFNQTGSALIDELNIDLNKVNVGIGLLDDGNNRDVSASCRLLKPLTFSLTVFRNLNFATVKDLPELTVQAVLPTVDVSMSQADYALIMHTLSGNLTEGVPPPPPPTIQTVEKGRTGDAAANAADEPVTPKPKKSTVADVVKKASEIAKAEKARNSVKRLVFKFSMGDIVATLHTGDSGLEYGKGVVERSEETAFAALKLHSLLVAGFMQEDNGLETAITLESFAMTDDRQGHTQIRQLMDKKAGHEKEKFVNLQFKQSGKGDQDIVLQSSAFFLYLCPEFLGHLSSFFAVPKSPEEAAIPPELVGRQKLAQEQRLAAAKSKSVVTVAANESVTGVVSVTPEEPAPPKTGALRIKGAINDIEVILIENSLKPRTSQALILSLSATVDGDTANGKQIIDAQIRDLQIISTYFALELRSLSPYNVLNKLTIAAHLEIDMGTQGQVVDVKMDPVHLKVSPAIIRLLSSVGTQFSEHQTQALSMHTARAVRQIYPGYWLTKKFDRHEYWWFNDVDEEGKEVFEVEEGGTPPLSPAAAQKVEKATVNVPRFVITLEAGTESETVPMILVETGMSLIASDWSSSLACDASTQLQISYYNDAFSVWEPVIEPILVKGDNNEAVWQPWALTTKVRSPKEDENNADTGETGVNGIALQPPKMSITVDSNSILNFTVTKSFLGLLNDLSKAFEAAAKQVSPPKERFLPGTSPYLILNNSGVAVSVTNSESMIVTEDGTSIDTTHGGFVELNVVGWTQKVGLQHAEDNRTAHLTLELLKTVRDVNVLRAEVRALRLPEVAPSGKQWTMVVDTSIENSRRVVTLKSLVSVVNHTSGPIEVHSLRDTTLYLAGVADPDVTTPLDIPLPLIYTSTGHLHFKPANDLYEPSNEGVSWHEFESGWRSVIRCDESANTRTGIYYDLVAVDEPVHAENSSAVIDKRWTIHVYPPLTLRNLLPFNVSVTAPTNHDLAGGDDVALNVVPGHSLTLKTTFDEDAYTAVFDIQQHRSELEIITFVADDDQTKELHLGIHWSTQHLRLDCQIYAPYWFVNNTQRNLSFMESVKSNMLSKTTSSCSCTRRRYSSKPDLCVGHEPDKNPLVLPFADKNFLSKKKARVRFEKSEWSEEFPLDTAGSAARVICKEGSRQYELTIDIQICQSGLTKVVSFSPFYLLYNDSLFAIEVKEPEEDQWTLVAPESCTGLWPKSTSKRKTITARYAETKEESIPFPFTENFEAFCSIHSDSLGIYATCSVGESSSVVHVEPFEPGMAPAFIMNATSIPVEFAQKGHSKKIQLQPWEVAPFRWEDVTTHDRALNWASGEYTAEDKLLRNGFGNYLPVRDKAYHYWVSFLFGRQRYLLLTDDVAVVTTALQTYEVERMDMDVEMNIEGIGISIVNNLVSQEIIYMGISCSGIVWEYAFKNRYKSFTVKEIEALEAAYQTWLTEGEPEGKTIVTLPGKSISVDFGRLIYYGKGKKQELKIKRNFANGLWMRFRQSAHQKQIHIKLNHIQIDNQLPACVFPCVLAVVPPPKSVVADNTPKPFTEISISMQQPEHSNIVQYKYAHVLIQEFAVRVDQGLINSLITMFATEETTAPYNKAMFAKDMELAKSHLSEKAISTAVSQQKAFYDDLHISPLMIHLSFSQGGVPAGAGPRGNLEKDKKDDEGGIKIQSEFINVLLKSVGVSVTELQDVVFKLAFFERKGAFCNMAQLQAEIQSHYTIQFVKQLYVLVLGLDIIGNPFGLVRDLSTGVEDLFYQPFQGAIQGPEEFAEGIALGVTSLFGHAVGGAAGAVSRITGTIGKGLAALTLDKDYQRKRQEAINRRPQNLSEGLTRAGKNLGQGFYDGVTGIVTKPVEGFQTGGVGGFLTGFGKGLVGAVTRPVSGVVDFASDSLNAVKTIAGSSHEAQPLRPPRVIPRDQIVRPYSYTDAIGYKIYRDTDRGKFADTDFFCAHAFICDKIVLIVTDKRVFLAKRQDVLGTWVADWELPYDEIKTIKPSAKGISFELKHQKRGFLNIGTHKGKVVEIKDKVVLQRITDKVLNAFEVNEP